MKDVKKEQGEKEDITLVWMDNSREQMYFMRLCSICGAKVHYPWTSRNRKAIEQRSCVCPGCRKQLKLD